jgi:riboflavin synthase
MFTGLIAEVGRIEELHADGDGARLRIAAELAGELREGDSVAVNGVCLTATAVTGGGFATEAMPETLQRSSLGGLGEGDAVNLELALRAADRLGGHVVQGHVDGTGTVTQVQPEGFSTVVEIEVDSALARYLVEKGSVAVDGVSLTVSSLGDDTFAVSLIPETLTRTTLGALAPGAKVNIEVDVLAKHVERLIRSRPAEARA